MPRASRASRYSKLEEEPSDEDGAPNGEKRSAKRNADGLGLRPDATVLGAPTASARASEVKLELDSGEVVERDEEREDAALLQSLGRSSGATASAAASDSAARAGVREEAQRQRGSPKKRPPTLLELGDGDEAKESVHRPGSKDSVQRPGSKRSVATPERSFQAAAELALKSPMAVAARGLQQRLDALAHQAESSASASAPATPHLRELDALSSLERAAAASVGPTPRSSMPAAQGGGERGATGSAGPTPRSLLAPGSPAALQALQTAKVRLVTAATAAKAAIVATTPKSGAAGQAVAAPASPAAGDGPRTRRHGGGQGHKS